MVRYAPGMTPEKEYDELYKRVEKSVEFTGSETEEEFADKVLNDFIPNTSENFPFGKMYDRFKNTDKKKNYDRYKDRARAEGNEVLQKYEDKIDDGIDASRAYDEAKREWEDEQRRAIRAEDYVFGNRARADFGEGFYNQYRNAVDDGINPEEAYDAVKDAYEEDKRRAERQRALAEKALEIATERMEKETARETKQFQRVGEKTITEYAYRQAFD